MSAKEAYALAESAKISNMNLTDFLYYHSHYDLDEVAVAYAHYFGLKKITLTDLTEVEISNDQVQGKRAGQLITAIYKPDNLTLSLCQPPPYLITANEYFSIKKTAYPKAVPQQQEEQTTIAYLDHMLKEALYQRASDIHIEPTDDSKVSVRFRIDGMLTPHRKIDKSLNSYLITRLKVIAHADITQTRLPQDGRFTFTNQSEQCDCRVNFCPTLHGEKIVIRLLNSHQHILQFNELGLEAEQKQLFINTLNQNQGLILVTGPTGSGKTQTLYTAINYLNRTTANITTIEDPVEITLHGINQINIDESLGLSFPIALRALLRQDPDVIMVGEIRDSETAALTIRAAQTGHLVLATLHTQDTLEAILRLENLGISRLDIASSLKLVIAQRLIKQFGLPHLKSRTGIFELLAITPSLQYEIVKKKLSLELKKIALTEGFQPLSALGQSKVRQGLTTTEALMHAGITISDQPGDHVCFH